MLTINIDGTIYQSPRGANLLALLRGQGFPIAADCNGKGTCGQCAVLVDGETRLACQTTLERDCNVQLSARVKMQVLDDYSPGQGQLEPREGYGIAIDLGTTTVAMERIDLSTGQTLDKQGFENPQRAYGADVISRIAASKAHAGELRKLICNSIQSRINSNDQVTEIVISGNTTMIYLLLGYDPACLGVYPFEPATQLQNPYAYADIFGGPRDCPVYIVPWISAFVGGDIVSGLLTVPLEAPFLLVDLGTNGEIALYAGGELYCTATAAGPAFEGRKAGLYGSDVLDIVAGLLRDGLIDETGLLEGECVFTQQDIREIQLAKSAVRTGLEILLDTARRPAVETVYLCGGFGKALDVRSALEIGLFPANLRGRALGNTSLAGAALLLKNPTARSKIPAILAARHINLSAHPKFNEYFMEYMGFE